MLTTQGLIVGVEYSPSREVVILRCQVTEPFSFLEGQFMMLQTLIGDEIVKRAYSIYSTNQDLQDGQTISFCIKRKEGGLFSTRATQVAQEGMQITMTGPLGKFVDSGLHSNYLFVSVGSGLSPCFSIYMHLLATSNYDKMVNLFGERYLDHVPEEVLTHYSLQDDKVKNMIYLSREEMSDKLQAISLRSGYVQDGLDDAIKFLIANGELLINITVFICGLPAMCDDVAQRLVDKGFEKSQLVIEKY